MIYKTIKLNLFFCEMIKKIKYEKIRFDLVFSYWIFVWFLLYSFKMTHHSPKIALIFSLIENFILFMFMLGGISTWRNIVYFLFVNFIIKIIPFYFVMNDKLKWDDFYFLLVIFSLYLIWIGINVYITDGKIQINTIESVLQNKNMTPGMYILHQMFD